ncbi:hypothetical protein J1605_000351 [Eschrichtius robustus]|uniref:Uncharacterized protein n=1 Tax=Eschrichtius robustus TaxID=9764 RepID=A0AB34HC18_ESCRO|nr:hypothetical protein J1605_000351 [Eschrichtius robustus]
MRKSEFWSLFGQQEPGSSHVTSLGSAAFMCKWRRHMGAFQTKGLRIRRKSTKPVSGVGEVEGGSGRQWLLCFRLPDTPLLAPTLIPPGRELRFPERVLCDTNPEQAAGAFGLPGPEARVLPQKSPPLPGPQSEASTSPRAKERAVGAGGRRLEGFPSFKLRLLGVTGRIRSFRFRGGG